MGIKNNGGNWEETDVSRRNEERLYSQTYPNSGGYAFRESAGAGDKSLAASGNVCTGGNFIGGLPGAAGGIASHLIEDYEEQMAHNSYEIARLTHRNKVLGDRLIELKKIQQEMRSHTEHTKSSN
jgi:hypothetical protein